MTALVLGDRRGVFPTCPWTTWTIAIYLFASLLFFDTCQGVADEDISDAASRSADNVSALASASSSASTSSAANTSLYPYFDLNVHRNVTTAEGQTGFLHCRVHHLGDKAVSWIRQRDLHILTAGVLTYTSDQRFTVIRPDRSENWTLQIRSAQKRDSGKYECQVNTEPKMSLQYDFHVIEWKAQILGLQDLYVKTGSAVTLTCVIRQGPHDLGTVQWFLGDRPLNGQELHSSAAIVHSGEGIDAGAVSSNTVDDQEVARERPRDGQRLLQPRVRIVVKWTDALTSQLIISRALPSDSGNYTCKPTSLAAPATVNVQVINGEYPAAMQHGNKNTASVISLQGVVYATTAFALRRFR